MTIKVLQSPLIITVFDEELRITLPETSDLIICVKKGSNFKEIRRNNVKKW